MQHILDLFLMMLFFVMLLPAAAQYQWSEEVTRSSTTLGQCMPTLCKEGFPLMCM